MVFIIFELILGCFGIFLMTFEAAIMYMPYAMGVLGGMAIFAAVPILQNIVPGHFYMSLFLVICVVETIIFILKSIEPIEIPVTVFFSTLFLMFLCALVFMKAKPDSVGYCIVMTIIYAAIMHVGLVINLRDVNEANSDDRNLPEKIVAGIINAASGLLIFGFPYAGIWYEYIKTIGYHAQMFKIIGWIAAAIISLIIFVRTLLYDCEKL